ncbi:39S ribosomal protein L40, mitochondrial [Nymphon striatum]|nr:39S ribosomal protein L40, mitochondrial [Nymphon striatum]
MPIYVINYSLFRIIYSSQCATQLRTVQTASSPLLFRISADLWKTPMKKKSRSDGDQQSIAEKRKKRIERNIRKLSKVGRKLKPIDELEIPSVIKNEEGERRRPFEINADETKRRAAMKKNWSLYKYNQYLNEAQMIRRLITAQDQALQALREESEDLYQAATQIDSNLLPFKCDGPTETPPITNYESPDGDYLDVTKRFDKKI